MTGEFIGLVAVVLTLGIPVAGMYTYYHVRKLRTQERLAAMARGVEIPMVADLSESARSRRAGILLCAGAVGVIASPSGFIAQIERDPEVWIPAAFAIVPLAVGIGYFLDYSLIAATPARIKVGKIGHGCVWAQHAAPHLPPRSIHLITLYYFASIGTKLSPRLIANPNRPRHPIVRHRHFRPQLSAPRRRRQIPLVLHMFRQKK